MTLFRRIPSWVLIIRSCAVSLNGRCTSVFSLHCDYFYHGSTEFTEEHRKIVILTWEGASLPCFASVTWNFFERFIMLLLVAFIVLFALMQKVPKRSRLQKKWLKFTRSATAKKVYCGLHNVSGLITHELLYISAQNFSLLNASLINFFTPFFLRPSRLYADRCVLLIWWRPLCIPCRLVCSMTK